MKSLPIRKIPTKKSKELCPIHHINLVYTDKIEPFCPLCVAEKIEQEKDYQSKTFADKNTRLFLKRNSLVDDPTELKYNFDTFKATKGSKEAEILHKTKVIAYEYMTDKDKKFNTIFYGTPGEGKTHLAMSMLNAVNSHAKPAQKCLFVNVNSLFLAIKRSFDDPMWQWTEQYAVKKLSSADLLVIDDLGSESVMASKTAEASNFVQRILYQVTNRQKRIITTTNLTMEQLKRAYNPKLVSRLMAGSARHQLDFSGIKDKRYEVQNE